MIVVDKKPVPIYEVVCPECRSKIKYKKSEACTCHITCPVCGSSIWADAIAPDGYAVPSNYDRLISKTPEELAEWLTGLEIRAYERLGYSGHKERFKAQYLEWLKSPVKAGDGNDGKTN